MSGESGLNSELRFGGIAASRGIAIGPAFHYQRTLLFAEDRTLNKEQVAVEVERFAAAVLKARAELEKIRQIAEQKVGVQTSGIFEAQMMMVSDEIVLGEIRERIVAESKPAAYAVDTTLSEQQHHLQKAENAALRERVDDLEDVKQRLLRNLLVKEKWLSKIDRPSIIVARSITPADAILFSRTNVLGYAIDGGGVTSHAAILARSLDIPALVALHNAADKIATGDLVILDGERGELILHPEKATLEAYEQERKSLLSEAKAPLEALDNDIPGVRTRDGHAVMIAMNLEFGSEAAIAEAEHMSQLLSGPKDKPSIGIGLVRTEHFLMLNEEFPTEEEQNLLYRDIANRFQPEEVTIRTFDVGGDKVLAGSYREENPFLGWRGLRISLDEPDIFLGQLRAALRASVQGNVKLMFPMVTNVDELERALVTLEDAKRQLRDAGEAFDEQIETGIMVEVPAAAMMAHAFAPLIDFFSIGTNDLTQYTLAVDRGNDLVAGLYQELHPAVLRLIDMTTTAAHNAGKRVSVCGELGSYPLATPVLVGMGVDELSVSPSQVRSLAARIRLFSYTESSELSTRILAECTSVESVKQHIQKFLSDRQLLTPFLEEKGRFEFGNKLIKR